jgi:YggT family protein
MIAQAGLFLLETLTGFLTFALLLRFYMQACRVSFNNQIGTFVVELTNWLVRPLRKLLPGWYGLDLASLLPAYLLQVIFASR